MDFNWSLLLYLWGNLRRCCFSFYLCFPFSLNNSTSTANYPCPVPPVELLGPFSKLLHIHAMSSLYPQCPLITQSQSRKQASHIRTNTFFFCLIFSTYLKKNDAGSGVAWHSILFIQCAGLIEKPDLTWSTSSQEDNAVNSCGSTCNLIWFYLFLNKAPECKC